MGDGQIVIAERESENGIGGGVDQTDAHALAGLRLEDLRCFWNPTVDEEVGVGHVPRVTPGLKIGRASCRERGKISAEARYVRRKKRPRRPKRTVATRVGVTPRW